MSDNNYKLNENYLQSGRIVSEGKAGLFIETIPLLHFHIAISCIAKIRIFFNKQISLSKNKRRGQGKFYCLK